MGEMKTIVLSKGTKVEIRGLTVIVYEPPFDKFVELHEKMSNFEGTEDVKKQMEGAVTILYELLKPNNPDLTKEDIKTKFTMKAFTTIIGIALGNTQK